MFVRLLEESVLAQAAVTVSLIVTVCTLAILGRPIPDLLAQAIWLVLGFYFGAKIENVKVRRAMYDERLAARGEGP
jgi:hypothetical protein